MHALSLTSAPAFLLIFARSRSTACRSLPESRIAIRSLLSTDGTIRSFNLSDKYCLTRSTVGRIPVWMGAHLIDGEFQSDKYPWAGRNFFPAKITDKRLQPMLWAMAQAYREVDAELTEDLEKALLNAGYDPEPKFEPFTPDWSKYPKLADMFQHRPTENVYWVEFRTFVANAIESAVRYVQDVRAHELATAMHDGPRGRCCASG